MKDHHSILIAKKEIEKEIIHELYKSGIMDWFQCSSILQKIDEDIDKVRDRFPLEEQMTNMVVKIPI